MSKWTYWGVWLTVGIVYPFYVMAIWKVFG
jgi:hypothetical protein